MEGFSTYGEVGADKEVDMGASGLGTEFIDLEVGGVWVVAVEVLFSPGPKGLGQAGVELLGVSGARPGRGAMVRVTK